MRRERIDAIADAVLEQPRERQQRRIARNLRWRRRSQRLVASIAAILGFWLASTLSAAAGIDEPWHWLLGVVVGCAAGTTWPPKPDSRDDG